MANGHSGAKSAVWADLRGVLAGRDFRRLFATRLVSQAGDGIVTAGVIIDAVRCAKLAKDRGIGGPVTSASSYFMKSPPEQYGDDVCRDLVEKFILGEVAR